MKTKKKHAKIIIKSMPNPINMIIKAKDIILNINCCKLRVNREFCRKK